MKRKIGFIVSIFALTLCLAAEPATAQWVRTNWPVGCCYQELRAAVIGNTLFVGSWVTNGQQSSGLGGVVRTTDFGDSWTQVNDSLTAPFGVLGTDLFASQGSRIFMSTNSGGNWSEAMDSGLPPSYYTFSFVTFGADLYGLGHAIYRSTDSGSSWRYVGPAGEPSSGYILSFCIVQSKLFAVYASGYSGQAWALCTSSDSGHTWVTDSSSSVEPFLGTITQCGSSILLGGDGVARSTNAGASWTQEERGLGIGSFIVQDTNLLAATSSGVCYSTNYGASWKVFNDGLPELRLLNGYSLALCGPYLFLVNDSLGLFRRPLSEFTGSNEVKSSIAAQLDLSPNPTTGLLTMQGAAANIQHITITNLLGQSLIEQSVFGAASFTLDLSKLPAGMYFARMEMGGEVVTKKIVKE